MKSGVILYLNRVEAILIMLPGRCFSQTLSHQLFKIVILCNKTANKKSIKYFILHYLPTCFGIRCDYHEVVIKENTQCTNNCSTYIIRITPCYS